MTQMRRSLLVLCSALGVLASGLAVSGQGPRQLPDQANALLNGDGAGEGLTIRDSDRDGRVRFAAIDPSRRGIRVARPASAAAEERALAFVDRYGDRFGVGGRGDLRPGRRSSDALGEHVRFAQLHRGIPVTGGALIVHLRGNEVIGANGSIFAGLPESVAPSITAQDADAFARVVVGEREPAQAAGARYSAPRLEIWVPEAFGDSARAPRLAYFIEATGAMLRRFIWIDALTGETLLSFSQLSDAKTRNIFTANNTNQLPGQLVRVEGGPATGDLDADRAYDYSGATYDYYKNTHNRDSFDDQGATLFSTVHACDPGLGCPMANAFWNGVQMVYGTGFASADDVVAHELTHAVTEWSAGLIYYREAGALNESFSDIFGETVDLTDGAGTDTAGVRWNIGEDLPIGAIRNMLTPTLFGDPGKRSDPQYMCELDDTQDHGGVHRNSGIPNHAYALAVDGGTYNGRTVLPIGLTKAGLIWYRALTVYLTSSSVFLDAYLAISQSATDLIGTNGVTASDRDQVVTALQAVEMNVPETDVCLRLLSPNGGQTRTVGVGAFVTWDSSDLNPAGQIYLLLSKDGGQSLLPTPLAVLPPSATSYFWTPAADHVTNTARLFVGNRVNGSYEAADWSDANFTVAGGAGLDLIVTSATAPPALASPGSTYVITDTTLNQGGATTGTTYNRFYLSLDMVKNSGDRLLSGSRTVPPLAGGASSTGSSTVQIAASTPPGTYFQLVCADEARTAVETNETNNCLASGSTVQIALPDLQATALTDPPANVAVGAKFVVNDTVLNPSAVPAPASATLLYLSLDAVKDPSDILLTGGRNVPALAAGTSSTGPAQVGVPAATPLQTYRLIACADGIAKVAETNEANNCITAAGSVVVGIPDLVTSQLGGLPATVLPGAKMILTATALNQGSAPAGASIMLFYLSLDAAWSANDVLLSGGRSVPALAAGASSAGSGSLGVPAATPAGAYFVIACADDLKKVLEGNETNNCRVSATTVAVGP